MNISPAFAYATVEDLINSINRVIINPLIILIFTVALVYFIYGVIVMVAGAGSEEKRATGRQHMIWGIVGMFIMISVFAIMKLVAASLGADTSGLPT